MLLYSILYFNVISTSLRKSDCVAHTLTVVYTCLITVSAALIYIYIMLCLWGGICTLVCIVHMQPWNRRPHFEGTSARRGDIPSSQIDRSASPSTPQHAHRSMLLPLYPVPCTPRNAAHHRSDIISFFYIYIYICELNTHIYTYICNTTTDIDRICQRTHPRPHTIYEQRSPPPVNFRPRPVTTLVPRRCGGRNSVV